MSCPLCDMLERFDKQIKEFKRLHVINPNSEHHTLEQIEKILEENRIEHV